MEHIKQKKTSPLIGFILIVMVLMTSIFTATSMSIKASAEGAEESITVEKVIDNMTFITFSKAENEQYGKHIFGYFYIPNAVYEASFEYGVIAFPRFFAEKYGITGNYIEEYTAIGMQESLAIMKVESPASFSEGKVLKCGIREIPDAGIEIELAFIFYAKDTAGNIAYAKPYHGAYATLLVENYTNEEIALMIGQRLETENNFKQIVTKIEELIDAFWLYIIIASAAVVIVWGAIIGLRIAVARGKDEQINARSMLKNLGIGIIVVFAIAVAAPLLIKGLSAWISW